MVFYALLPWLEVVYESTVTVKSILAAEPILALEPVLDLWSFGIHSTGCLRSSHSLALDCIEIH